MGCGPVSGQSSLKHDTYRFRHCRGAQRTALSSLPPGQYKITVEDLPPNLDDEPVSVALSGGQCKEIHFRPDTSGEISGRLLPDEKMPSPAWVTLFAADDAPKRADSNEYTHEVAQLFADDETGKFVFRHVRPEGMLSPFSQVIHPT